MSFVHASGYRFVQMRDHPHVCSQGVIREHRVVMERTVGHPLDRKMHVHHKDGNKTNNDPGNLQYLTPREHTRIHAGWKLINDEWWKTCRGCNRFLCVNETNFHRRHSGHQEWLALCRPCNASKWGGKR